MGDSAIHIHVSITDTLFKCNIDVYMHARSYAKGFYSLICLNPCGKKDFTSSTPVAAELTSGGGSLLLMAL